MAVQIQIRRGLASEWASVNPTLLQGEWGLETDTKLTKLGDGVTAWNSLAYFTYSPGAGSITSSMIANGTIVDADISASAAIAQSKISGLTTALDSKPDLFIADTLPGSLGIGDFWLDTSTTI